MASLRECSYVNPPVSVRALAQMAGIRGAISLRELIVLLGRREFGPAPLYVFGHNTNSVEAVQLALDRGANALEVDVTAYEFDLNQLCVDHAGLTGDAPGRDTAPRFEDFLHALRDIARQRPELALVVFDCKPPAATPALGPVMLATIRRALSDETRVNVIISVANVTSSTRYKLDGSTLFDTISHDLGPREGLMIDETGNPDDVIAFFNRIGVGRHCYGYGTSSPVSDEGAAGYRLPIERACWWRTVSLAPRFVYAWTVNDEDDQKLYLSIGVNGIISDPEGIAHFGGLLREPQFAALYRLATRADNPFLPANAAFGLTVRTSDIDMAGTDARVTFTLTGSNGSSTVVVDSKYNGRLERNSTNYVVLPSRDLGELQTLSVQRDNSGNAPDWHLQEITIEGQRYGVHRTAQFDCWIDNTGQFTRGLN